MMIRYERGEKWYGLTDNVTPQKVQVRSPIRHESYGETRGNRVSDKTNYPSMMQEKGASLI